VKLREREPELKHKKTNKIEEELRVGVEVEA